MGSCIKTYMLCERKKNEIIKSTSSDSLELDGELCKAYTYAQNDIFREFLFLDVMYREIKSIRDGVVVKTKIYTKKKRKRRGKSEKKKIEHFSGGGGLSLDKLRKTISLFLLFSLKAYAENAEVAVFQDRFDTNTLALDPLNEEQMEEYTRRFGNLQNENYKPMKSENLQEKFHDTEEYYLYHSNTSAFHKDVRKQTFSLLNDNVYPVYERLLKICDVFIDQTTDTNPAEFGRMYAELSEQRESDHQKERLTYEQTLNDAYAIVRTKKQEDKSFWSLMTKPKPKPEPKHINNVKFQIDKVQDKSITLISSRNLLSEFDDAHHEKLYQTIHNEDEQYMLDLNRKKYLSGICRFSLKPPSLEYDEADGTITFNDFQKYRVYIDVIIRNVKAGATRANSKQKEMADFLQEALINWDSTFRDVVTNGHSGKKTMTEYGKKFKEETETLNKFLRLGMKGNPIALRKAIQQRNEAIKNKELNNITMEGKKIDSLILDEVNEYENEETAKSWRQFTYVNTAFLTDTSTYVVHGLGSGFDDLGSWARQYLYGTAVGLSIPVAMIAATALFVRWCWYRKINSGQQYDHNNNHYIGPPVLKLTDNEREREKKKITPAEIFQIRPNTLRAKLKNGQCPEKYKYVSRFQNCMPEEYYKGKDNYVNWYINKKKYPEPYDPDIVYDNLSRSHT